MASPTLIATQYAVSSGHELASQAAMDILAAGGNAVDAGVGAGLVLGVVHSDLVSVAGVAPMVIRMADTGKIVTIDGLDVWPKAATAEFFAKHHNGEMPEGLLRTVVPAAPAAWIKALVDFGTLSFADVASAAIKAARHGFDVYPLFEEIISTNESRYRRSAENTRIYLPNDRPPRMGERFVQADLARTLQHMVDEESACRGDRKASLLAARDAFYRGDIADTICRYHASNGGFLTHDDMAAYEVRYEAPLQAKFAGVDFYTCGAWCQGISLAQALRMMDADTLRSFAPNSAETIHYLTEVYKLVFADRERFVADPTHVDVPVEAMLDRDYLQQRHAMIDPARAFPEMPPAGDPRNRRPIEQSAQSGNPPGSLAVESASAALDTSHVGVIDAAGNLFAATPSDTSADTEVIPGTGLSVSSRGSQSRGVPGHINAVAPGKRPRLTPNPAIALRDGKPFMTLGTPGGDVQIQAMTQVVANMLCYKMDVQEAIDAPRFATQSFPSSFAPHQYLPGQLTLEADIDSRVGDALTGKGHRIERWRERYWKAGGVCVVTLEDSPTRSLRAGADPRRANVAYGK